MQVTSWIVPKPEVNRAAHWPSGVFRGFCYALLVLLVRLRRKVSRMRSTAASNTRSWPREFSSQKGTGRMPPPHPPNSRSRARRGPAVCAREKLRYLTPHAPTARAAAHGGPAPGGAGSQRGRGALKAAKYDATRAGPSFLDAGQD